MRSLACSLPIVFIVLVIHVGCRNSDPDSSSKTETSSTAPIVGKIAPKDPVKTEDENRQEKETTDKWKLKSPAKTPKEALEIYFASIDTGQLDRVKSVLLPFAQMDEVINNDIRYSQVFAEFNKVGIEKFGENPKVFSDIRYGQLMANRVAFSELELIDETHASCPLDVPSAPPLELISNGEGWKIDLTTPEFIESIPDVLTRFAGYSKVYQSLIDDMKSGKIETVEELVAEQTLRLNGIRD